MPLYILKRKIWFSFILFGFSLLTGLFFQNCGRLPESTGSFISLTTRPDAQSDTTPVPTPLPLTPEATSTEFYQKIKPILEARCLNCHSTGSIASHLPFETSDQVALRASFIKNAVTSRSMPPFDVSQDEGCNSPTFANDPRLTQTQIDTINSWIDQKVSAGQLNDIYERSISLIKGSAPKLITDGITVFMAPMKQSFTPSPPTGKVDQYRCFVLDSVTSTDKFLTAYEVLPGNSAIVHHMILYHPNTAADATAAQSLDSGSGYDCLGSASSSSKIVNAEPLVIWAPGVGVQELPPQTGLPIAGGRKLVLQVHYNVSNKTLGITDKSKIQLRLSDTVQSPANWISVSANSFTIPAGMSSYLVTGQTSIPTGYSGFYGVFPHMHSIGKKIRIENATTNQCYSFTPNWRFTWQLNYFYNTMVPITPGQQLRVNCTYDSTSLSTSTSFGEGSNDEMCFGFIYAVRPSSIPGPTGPSGFSLIPNVSGPISSLNLSTDINFATADVNLLKQIYVVAAVPRTDGGADYYFLSGGNWITVGTDLGVASWTPFQSSQNKTSELITILSAIDITAYPSNTSVYAGYGVARNSVDAKTDLLNNKTWGLVYQKP